MSQSPKTLEFLQKLKDSGNWNDEYDYSKVNFIRTKTKIDKFKSEIEELGFSVDHKTSSQKFVYFDCTKN
jgi:hypothetical protein